VPTSRPAPTRYNHPHPSERGLGSGTSPKDLGCRWPGGCENLVRWLPNPCHKWKRWNISLYCDFKFSKEKILTNIWNYLPCAFGFNQRPLSNQYRPLRESRTTTLVDATNSVTTSVISLVLPPLASSASGS
jgi:hypothetical protein